MACLRLEIVEGSWIVGGGHRRMTKHIRIDPDPDLSLDGSVTVTLTLTRPIWLSGGGHDAKSRKSWRAVRGIEFPVRTNSGLRTIGFEKRGGVIAGKGNETFVGIVKSRTGC